MNISRVLPMVKNLDGFMSNLTSVTSALQIAFDSTLLALFLSAALMLVQTLVYRRSEDLLARVDRWVVDHICRARPGLGSAPTATTRRWPAIATKLDELGRAAGRRPRPARRAVRRVRRAAAAGPRRPPARRRGDRPGRRRPRGRRRGRRRRSAGGRLARPDRGDPRRAGRAGEQLDADQARHRADLRGDRGPVGLVVAAPSSAPAAPPRNSSPGPSTASRTRSTCSTSAWSRATRSTGASSRRCSTTSLDDQAAIRRGDRGRRRRFDVAGGPDAREVA